MLKKILSLFILLFSFATASAANFVELPDEFLIVREDNNGREEWFHIDSPWEHLGKVFQNHNIYTLYTNENIPLATAKYGFGWTLKPYFHIKDREGKLLGILKAKNFRCNFCPCFELFSENEEKIFDIYTDDIYDDKRPFVFLDPDDQHPILVISNPIDNYWSIQIIDKKHFYKMDQRFLALTLTVLTDFRRWRS